MTLRRLPADVVQIRSFLERDLWLEKCCFTFDVLSTGKESRFNAFKLGRIGDIGIFFRKGPLLL